MHDLHNPAKLHELTGYHATAELHVEHGGCFLRFTFLVERFPDTHNFSMVKVKVKRVFKSAHGEAKPRTHDLATSFCTVIEPL